MWFPDSFSVGRYRGTVGFFCTFDAETANEKGSLPVFWIFLNTTFLFRKSMSVTFLGQTDVAKSPLSPNLSHTTRVLETRSCKRRKTSSVGVWLTLHSSNGPTIIGLPQCNVRTTHIVLASASLPKTTIISPYLLSGGSDFARGEGFIFFAREPTHFAFPCNWRVFTFPPNKQKQVLFSAPVSLPPSPPPFST